MGSIANEIIETYFASKQHDSFLLKNNTDENVKALRKELIEKFGEGAREEIDSSLFAAFNTGEYYGVMQGIGIGLQLVNECT